MDTTLASDNHSRFRKNLLERISKLITTIDDKIKDEKLQYHINREVAKKSALSFGKFDKLEYLRGAEILSPDQKKTKNEAKLTYSSLGKDFEKKKKKKFEFKEKTKLKLCNF